jgi:hypothetical protein
MRANNYVVTRYRKFIAVILTFFPMLYGCETLMDMDRPLPPSELLWIKPGVSNEVMDAEARQCGGLYLKAYDAKQVDAHDIYDLCMLHKGYTFVPKPEGWRNICAIEVFAKGIACQSTRSGFTLPPEK